MLSATGFTKGPSTVTIFPESIADVPDTVKNRKWMKEFKARWKSRLDQLEIWMVSYRIDIE